jgi:hypothetical protein
MCVAVLLIPPPRGRVAGRRPVGWGAPAAKNMFAHSVRYSHPSHRSLRSRRATLRASFARIDPTRGRERDVSDRVIPREGESGSIQYAGALQFITGALEYRGLRLRGRRRVLPRQVRRSHQKLIDRPRAQPPLPDRPDDERLAAAHVAGGEYVRPRGLIVCGIGPHICRAGRDRRQASSKRPPAPDAKPIPINRL